MHSLPRLVQFDLRLAASNALADIRPHLPDEDKHNGIHWGLYGLIDSSYDCPGDLLKFDEDWTHGHANYEHRARAILWQQAKAFQLAFFRKYENRDAVSAFVKPSYDRCKGRKGGAIILDVRIPETGSTVWTVLMSAAGTNEVADEGFLLRTAQLADWELVEPDRLECIARISNNPYHKQLNAA